MTNFQEYRSQKGPKTQGSKTYEIKTTQVDFVDGTHRLPCDRREPNYVKFYFFNNKVFIKDSKVEISILNFCLLYLC